MHQTVHALALEAIVRRDPTLPDRASLEQVGQVGRIYRVAEPRKAVPRIDVKEFLHGAQEGRVAVLDRVRIRFSLHVPVRVL